MSKYGISQLVAAAVVVCLVVALSLLVAGVHFHSDMSTGDHNGGGAGGRIRGGDTLEPLGISNEGVGGQDPDQGILTPIGGPRDKRPLPMSPEQQERFRRMEPPLAPSPDRPLYHNPYTPMMQTSQVCSNGSHSVGRWVKADKEVAPPYPSMGEILGCCQAGFERRKKDGTALPSEGNLTYRPETQYRWKSEGCELIPWSEELFCKALRGRDIMMAGDSLNDHWHASLYYLLGGRKDIYKREGTIRGKRACATHPICQRYTKDGKPLRLYFLTNQLLEEERRLNRNYKWWKHIAHYPILILNSGSWMRDPANEDRLVSDEEYQRHMIKALSIVKRQGFNGTLIWRTTYQGHPYCWRYTEPLTEELTEDDFPKVAPYLRYRWGAIPGRNAFATKMWKDAGAHILDVSRVTNLMPLGHLSINHPKYAVRNVTDCLHYCSPGPVYDTWSMLLMNMLLGNLKD